MYSEIKLVARAKDSSGTPPIFTASADIEFDSLGNFVMCNSDEGIEQITLKALLTETSPNDNYGTDMVRLKGQKLRTVIQSVLVNELSQSFNLVKSNQKAFLTKYATQDTGQVINTLRYSKVVRPDKTTLSIRFGVQTLRNKLEADYSQVKDVKVQF